jgi:hypothetical protein
MIIQFFFMLKAILIPFLKKTCMGHCKFIYLFLILMEDFLVTSILYKILFGVSLCQNFLLSFSSFPLLGDRM